MEIAEATRKSAITMKNRTLMTIMSRRLLTASMRMPAQGRAATVPIWKKVMARPASTSPPPYSCIMTMGSAAIIAYCVR